jgi:hypothetical protein
MAKHTAIDDRLDQHIPEDNRPGHEPQVVPDKPLVPPRPYLVPDAAPPLPGSPTLDEGLTVTHQFAFDRLFLGPAAVVGVLPMTSHVEVDAEALHIRFGPWSLRTPIDNVAHAETTGPYHLLKVLGPPHLSLRDGGVTFATNRTVGLCIGFHEPVPAIAPFGLLAHAAATVTVADPLALGRDLDRVRAGVAG